MKLYLVRHGESQLNAQRLHQPPSVALSAHGIKQVRTLAERFQTIPIDIILTSPFERARQTAELIGQRINKPIQTSELLPEVKRPSAIVGRHADEPEVVSIKKSIEEHAHDPHWRHSDEETFHDIKQRAQAMLEQLDAMSEKNVLAITHGHFMMVIASVMMFGDGLTPDILRAFIKTFAIQNTGITVCEKQPTGHWRILQWNDDAHLGELA